jgi:hypothetical protein
MLNKFWKDALERVLFTSLAAGLSAGGVYIDKLPSIWIPVGTVILTMVKTIIAGQLGDKSSAALLPKEN